MSKQGTFVAVAASVLAMTAVAGSAQAAERGQIQIKALATHVAVDGAITKVKVDQLRLPAGSDTRAKDAWVPTVAVEYFFSPRVSVETICCVTQHDVRGAGALKGATLVDNAEVIPATVTLKYHLPMTGGVKPYVGAGPAYFLVFGEGVGANAKALGATKVGLSSELGAALQAGVDIPLANKAMGLSIDVKRYFVDTTARFHAGDRLVLETEHELNPWVASAGLTWRF
ncbi:MULTISPECIES: OmpW family outer membrane protein [unclassified Caulobacter]|uniref:OmpW family outer membrane protein n=1 Tax=unclassified Caulobacter TaxID=2648921 RepID=UPI0007821B3D|nr:MULTISPECIES: OmpW family outer membrane protein [unclassified Caulobacter]AZS19814.1 OmpW family protein [Caulobacter sp. FWC26]